MHIAIDDTYGPEVTTGSVVVSGNRRTHVAVVFPDADAQYLRDQVIGCLEEMGKWIGITPEEFHFVDIYNRKSPWDGLQDHTNLDLFQFFASIYQRYRWPVLIQTIDSRTLRDHGIEKFIGKIEDFDLSNSADLSLLWLLIKIKLKYKQSPEPVSLFLDEGKRKPGTQFGSKVFRDWPMSFQGVYSSSASEPLLQIADFIAFCINRSTHLAMKQKRTEIDNWFLSLVGEMRINCDDFKLAELPENFSVADFDALHNADRADKGL